MHKIHLGVIGPGYHFEKNILPSLNKTKYVSLCGIYSRNKEKLAKFSRERKVETFESLSGLIHSPHIDVVYICTPTGTHADLAVMSLNAGKHVWIEKSLAPDLASWKEVIELANKKELAAFECFMFVYHKQFKEVQNLLSSGVIGNIKITAC